MLELAFTREKLSHSSIISLRGEKWCHKTRLPPPRFVEMPVPSHESKPSCIRVLGVSIWLLFLRIFDLILEFLRQCSMFCFSFLLLLILIRHTYRDPTKVRHNIAAINRKISPGNHPTDNVYNLP